MQRMAKEIGERVHRKADGAWNWNGREVFLVDGTTFSMPDTFENQLAYPKSDPNNAIGFPIMRAVALVSLATGAVLDMEFAKYAGKGTGEIGLFRKVSQSLPIGSIVVADRYYPTYSTMAGLKARGIDVVSISHAKREVDFTAGQILGPTDHIVQWTKGQVRDRINAEATAAYAALPETVSVREFVIDIDDRDGGKEQAIIVTTMTDPTIPQKELSDLYWTRWNCELDIRSIKHSLHMDILRAKTPSMVRKEIWAHLLAYNLLRGTMVETAKRNEIHPRQLSVKGTMQAVESFTPAMMAIDGSEAVYDAFLTTVSTRRVGNRPGRQEPRAKKRRPAWKVYMKKPRNKSHRKLTGEARQAVA